MANSLLLYGIVAFLFVSGLYHFRCEPLPDDFNSWQPNRLSFRLTSLYLISHKFGSQKPPENISPGVLMGGQEFET